MAGNADCCKRKARAMATTQETIGAGGGKPRSRAELEALFENPKIRALVKESREQVERGECVRIPISEIKRRLRIDE